MLRKNQEISYCAREVRRQDHDRFLTALFAPAERREALFALYAFNQELARIRETVSEPMLGEIRLQWWREAVSDIYAGEEGAQHEVAQALARAVRAHDLPRDLLDKIIDNRRQDLYDEIPPDLDSLLVYLRGTSGTLAVLASRILEEQDDGLRDLAERLGQAWGLIGVVRAIPYHLSLNKLFLPEDMMRKFGLEKSGLAAPERRQGVQRLVAELCERAAEELAAVRAQGTIVPDRAHSLFLLASLGRSYLASLRKAGHDPFAARDGRDALGRQMRLMRDGLFRRF